MPESKPLSLETYQQFLEFLRIGSRAVRRAQARNRELGIANVYSRNGKIYYELPDGKLTEVDPYSKKS